MLDLPAAGLAVADDEVGLERFDEPQCLARIAGLRNEPQKVLASNALEALVSYSWPGNVRELENALERALILAGDEDIEAVHVAAAGASPSGSPTAGEVLRPGFDLDAFERDLILAALDRAGGNKTSAARLLGISRRRLYSRLQSLGERDPAPEDEPDAQ